MQAEKRATTYSVDEVARHCSTDNGWVIVHNKVYDISDFIDSHPGGIQILHDHLGKDVTEVMQDDAYHLHTESAYSMLANYKIGRIEGTKQEDDEDIRRGWGKVDMHKPLVHQAGKLGKEYAMWAETEPLHFKESAKMFGNPFLEMFSRTPWYVVPLVWIPIICGLLYASSQSLPMWQVSLTYSVGLSLWFLLEWTLHRFLFHWWGLAQCGNYFTNIIHFLLHGFHHKLPLDGMRLVMPPLLFAALSYPFVQLAFLLFDFGMATALIAGAYTGYVYYDMMHFWLHHGADFEKKMPQPFSDWWKNLRTHHMVHHFAGWNTDINYGISNRFLDQLFNTLRV